MLVVATAGHVDHGKSTLVRALTGTDPDRLAEERRRGLTIELGFAWAALPSGRVAAFVDVPGHQRFFANTLVGMGPIGTALLVVAADEGWCAQSGDHLAALDALGVDRGLLVVTRCDLEDPTLALLEAEEQLAGTSLEGIGSVAVSAHTGEGMDDLVAALDDLAAAAPDVRREGRVRLWLDRAFHVRGSGLVVTGTLEAGAVEKGQELELDGVPVRVRGVQSLGVAQDRVEAPARVAVNLRGADAAERGAALLTPGAWRVGDQLDVRLALREGERLPLHATLHLGTAATAVRVRPLGDDAYRLTLVHPLPAQVGDRGLLRSPGGSHVLAGLVVLDPAPPELRARGAARARAAGLASATGEPDLVAEVWRRGVAHRDDLARIGVPPEAPLPDAAGIRSLDGWLVTADRWESWVDELRAAVERHLAADPLSAGLPEAAAGRAIGLPDHTLLPRVAEAAGLARSAGRLRPPGAEPSDERLEATLAALAARLAKRPFVAPEREELTALGVGAKEIGIAVRRGLALRLGTDLLLPVDAPRRGLEILAALPQPFSTAEGREALATTRRVALPLFEYYDQHGWTRRVDDSHRHVVRRTDPPDPPPQEAP